MGAFLGPFWGLLPGLASKTVSKAHFDPFGGRLGGQVGSKNEQNAWEGYKKSALPTFRFGARFGSPPGAVWDPFGGPTWGQNRSPSRSGKTAENKTPTSTFQEPDKARQDPPPRPKTPKDPPRTPQDGPGRALGGPRAGPGAVKDPAKPPDPPPRTHPGTPQTGKSRPILGLHLGRLGLRSWQDSRVNLVLTKAIVAWRHVDLPSTWQDSRDA